MFRFFNKKEEIKNARPPYSVTNGLSNESMATTEGMNSQGVAGGGFFNLPPVGTNTTSSGRMMNTSMGSTMEASLSNPYVPATGVASVPSGESMSMFSGMSVKPTAASPPLESTYPPATAYPQTNSYQSSNEYPTVNAYPPANEYPPVNAYPQTYAPPNNYPSSTTALSSSPAGRSGSLRENRDTEIRRMSTGEASDKVEDHDHPTGAHLVRSGTTYGKPKRKKKGGFKPGFGRRVSEETAAALQRGEINDEALLNQALEAACQIGETNKGEEIKTSSPQKMGTESERIPSQSVFSGLNIRNDHGKQPSEPGPTFNSQPTGKGTGLLAGLKIRSVPRSGGGMAGSSFTSTDVEEIENSILTNVSTHPDKVMTTDKLELARQDFRTSVNSFLRDFESCAAEESELIVKYDQCKAQIAQYNIDLSEIDSLQEKACEEEDFERADSYNTKINYIRHCLTLSQTDLRGIECEIENCIKKKSVSFSHLHTQAKAALSQLKVLKVESTDILHELVSAFEVYDEETKKTLATDNSRIEEELSHSRLAYEQLQQEEDEIEKQVMEECVDEAVERDELLVAKAKVDEEIAELEAAIALKRKEALTIESKLSDVNEEINKQREKFAPQLSNISMKRKELGSIREAIDNEFASIKEREGDYEERKRKHEQDKENLENRIQQLKDDMGAAIHMSRLLQSQDIRREHIARLRLRKEKEMTDLKAMKENSFHDYKVLDQKKSTLEEKVLVCQRTIEDAKEGLPKLEIQKKKAAIERNFKEAARLSKEIKVLTSQKERAEEDIQTVKEEVVDIDRDLERSKTRLDEMEESYNAKEKEFETEILISKPNGLYEERREIRRMMKRMKKSLHNKEEEYIGFTKSVLTLLEMQLDSLERTITKIEETHGISNLDTNVEEEEIEDDEDDDKTSVKSERREEVEEEEECIAEIQRRPSNEGGYNLKEVCAQIEAIEKLVTAAVEQEDFEKADSLSSETSRLENIKQRIEERLKKLEGIDEKLEVLRKEEKEYDAKILEAIEKEEYDLGEELDSKLKEIKEQIVILDKEIKQRSLLLGEENVDDEKENSGEITEAIVNDEEMEEAAQECTIDSDEEDEEDLESEKVEMLKEDKVEEDHNLSEVDQSECYEEQTQNCKEEDEYRIEENVYEIQEEVHSMSENVSMSINDVVDHSNSVVLEETQPSEDEHDMESVKISSVPSSPLSKSPTILPSGRSPRETGPPSLLFAGLQLSAVSQAIPSSNDTVVPNEGDVNGAEEITVPNVLQTDNESPKYEQISADEEESHIIGN